MIPIYMKELQENQRFPFELNLVINKMCTHGVSPSMSRLRLKEFRQQHKSAVCCAIFTYILRNMLTVLTIFGYDCIGMAYARACAVCVL